MSGNIYHDIRKLGDDVFCRKETLGFALVSKPRSLPATPNSVSFSTWNFNNRPMARVVRTPVKLWRISRLFLTTSIKYFVKNVSVWEYEYLQHSWIIFPRCSTVILFLLQLET